ncbi:hypothetical protein RBB50_002489 [Rhinocladiella similis]
MFWEQTQLPSNTAPRKDTKGLSLWETDDLLDAVQQESSVQESVTPSRDEVSKNSMSQSYLRQHATQHLQEETETEDDDFDNSSVLDLQGSSSEVEIEPRSWLAGQVKGSTNSDVSNVFGGFPVDGNYFTRPTFSASVRTKMIELPLRLKRDMTENSSRDRNVSEGDPGSESPPGMLERTAFSQMKEATANNHKRPPCGRGGQVASDETGGASFLRARSDSLDEDEKYCRGIV